MAEYGDHQSISARDERDAFLLLWCDLSRTTCLCLQHEHYSAIFLSREDDDEVRDIGIHDFCSVLLHPVLPNANLFIEPWTIKDWAFHVTVIKKLEKSWIWASHDKRRKFLLHLNYFSCYFFIVLTAPKRSAQGLLNCWRLMILWKFLSDWQSNPLPLHVISYWSGFDSFFLPLCGTFSSWSPRWKAANS